MAPNRGLTAEQERRVIELYQAGATNTEIFEATGVTRSTVYYLLQKYGVEPNRQRRPDATSADQLASEGLEILAAMSAAQAEDMRTLVRMLVDIQARITQLDEAVRRLSQS